jgi:hypothetical protein
MRTTLALVSLSIGTQSALADTHYLLRFPDLGCAIVTKLPRGHYETLAAYGYRRDAEVALATNRRDGACTMKPPQLPPL